MKRTVVKLRVFHLTEGNSSPHKGTLWLEVNQIQLVFKGAFGICNSDQAAGTLENTKAASESVSPYLFSPKGHMILISYEKYRKKGHCSISWLKCK